ncbi:hypothetical protein ACW7G0_10550 [Lysobacter sp. A286]
MTAWNKLTNRNFMLAIGLVATATGIALLFAGWLIGHGTLLYGGVVCCGTGAIWLVCARWTNTDRMRTVDRRYAREFFLAIGSYMAIMLLVWPMLEYVQGTAARALIALSPVLPVVFIGRSVMRRVRDGDELERRIFLEAAAIAGLTVGVLSMAAAFLQTAGLVHLHGGLMWVFPGLFAVFGIALWWTKRRYREE